MVRIVMAGLLVAIPLLSQMRLDSRRSYERVLCVVPMVGAGTAEDPRRPAYAPLPRGRSALARDGILAFTYQVSDDGRLALVEFVAADAAAFRGVKEDSRAEVKVFERGKAKRDDIEREFRKYKKDFDLDRFGVGLP